MKTKTQVKVKAEKLRARALLTIGPDDAAWLNEPPHLDPVRINGAIVRLQPPGNATDERIVQLKRAFEEMGAAIVRTDSRATADLPPLPPLEERASLDQRTVVMRLAEGLPRAPELKELLDIELSRVAL